MPWKSTGFQNSNKEIELVLISLLLFWNPVDFQGPSCPCRFAKHMSMVLYFCSKCVSFKGVFYIFSSKMDLGLLQHIRRSTFDNSWRLKITSFYQNEFRNFGCSVDPRYESAILFIWSRLFYLVISFILLLSTL